jgi:uncharacterized protein YlzI (FlbEa/FlbD family)
MLRGGLDLLATYVERDVEENIELGIIPEDEDIKEKIITFYVIEMVEPEDEYTCTITSGGNFYFILESADSVNKKIKERQNFLYN